MYMKRNLLDYKQVMDALERERQALLNREQYEAEDVLIEHAINVIAELPVIRRPEIVRCEDCINYNSLVGYCENGSYPKPHFFCADGKRKEGR